VKDVAWTSSLVVYVSGGVCVLAVFAGGLLGFCT